MQNHNGCDEPILHHNLCTSGPRFMFFLRCFACWTSLLECGSNHNEPQNLIVRIFGRGIAGSGASPSLLRRCIDRLKVFNATYGARTRPPRRQLSSRLSLESIYLGGGVGSVGARQISLRKVSKTKHLCTRFGSVGSRVTCGAVPFWQRL